jgi:hypothetical protein
MICCAQFFPLLLRVSDLTLISLLIRRRMQPRFVVPKEDALLVSAVQRALRDVPQLTLEYRRLNAEAKRDTETLAQVLQWTAPGSSQSTALKRKRSDAAAGALDGAPPSICSEDYRYPTALHIEAEDSLADAQGISFLRPAPLNPLHLILGGAESGRTLNRVLLAIVRHT